MANTVVSGVLETTVLRLDTAADNIVVGRVNIQLIVWEPVAIGDTLQIENSAEQIKFIITARDVGTAANENLPPIILPFPNGLRMNGLSLGVLGTSNVVNIFLV